MGEGLAAWVLDAPGGFGDAGFHSHHAIQLTISLSGDLSLTCGGETRSGQVIAVATDTLHRFAASGLLAFVFVEPESPSGRALSESLFRDGPMIVAEEAGFVAAIEPLRGAFEGPMERAVMLDIASQAVAVLGGETAASLPDARIRQIIRHALAHPELSLDQAAAGARVFLSGSRLRHLFVEQTGLAFKTYMLWQRLMRALEVYANGQSLTEAAHQAGFSDSAHFSRVFKRYFGLPATTLTRL